MKTLDDALDVMDAGLRDVAFGKLIRHIDRAGERAADIDRHATAPEVIRACNDICDALREAKITANELRAGAA